MAVLTVTATRQGVDATHSHGFAGNVKALVATTELAAADATSTVSFGYIPTNARILGISEVAWDDLATTGSPTLDIGLFGDQITDDDDALNDGLDLSSAGSASAVGDAANYGKLAYVLAGETADPGGKLEVKGTTKDAATDTTGTVTLQLLYVVE